MVSDQYTQALLVLVLMGSLESCPTGVTEMYNGMQLVQTDPVNPSDDRQPRILFYRYYRNEQW